MTKVKAGIPQGTRDFPAEVVKRRSYIIQTIQTVFELFGFQPLETPAMENLETLLGKYGNEGDKLIFKILNNGLDNPAKRTQVQKDFEKILEGKNVKEITERALRYDLTIPFARYVAMNQGILTFPFKRYQVQPVWRADRPQKGRYREFYQCDADVVGSYSLMNEVELANIYDTVCEKLEIDAEIKINNRKILSALAEICDSQNNLTDITMAIDKLDKIGLDKVKAELNERGLKKAQIDLIEKYLSISGSNEEKISQAKALVGKNETGKKGIEEIEWVINFLSGSKALSVDFTLARGLDYYTGIIFEVRAKKAQIGSIGGGGRYDDLTGTFGVPGIPGVGISFGLDRIYDVMEELKLFPETVSAGTRVLFFNLGQPESKMSFRLMQELRNKGISSEIYPDFDATKDAEKNSDRQFKYAKKRNIPYIIIIGKEELANKNCRIKDLRSGRQEIVEQSALVNFNFI